MVNPLNAPRPRSQTSNPPSSKLSPIWGSSIASSKPTLPPVQEDDESIPPQQRQLLTTLSWYQAPLASRTPLQFYHSPAVSVSQPQRIGSVSQRGVIPSSGATPDLMTHLRQSLPLPANPRISEIGHSHPSLFAPPPSTVHPPRPAPQDYYVVPRPSSSRPAIAHVRFLILRFSSICAESSRQIRFKPRRKSRALVVEQLSCLRPAVESARLQGRASGGGVSRFFFHFRRKPNPHALSPQVLLE